MLMGPGAVIWNTSVPLKERNLFSMEISKKLLLAAMGNNLKSYLAGK